MRKKKEMPAAMPRRTELSDTPVKLCNEICRLFRARVRANETQEGVMTQQGAHLVLSTLAIHDGINQLELVRQTHLRPPTVSVILKKMEAEGLVERKSDPDDLRSVRVYLSDAGRDLDRENIARIKRLDAIAMKDLSDEEVRVLMELLPKIRNNLLDERNQAIREEKEEKEGR